MLTTDLNVFRVNKTNVNSLAEKTGVDRKELFTTWRRELIRRLQGESSGEDGADYTMINIDLSVGLGHYYYYKYAIDIDGDSIFHNGSTGE